MLMKMFQPRVKSEESYSKKPKDPNALDARDRQKANVLLSKRTKSVRAISLAIRSHQRILSLQ